MKLHRHQIKNFSSKIVDIVEEMIANFEYEDAETTVKRLLSKTNYDNRNKSVFYVLLGKLKYVMGQISSAKRFYKTAIRLNPKNFEAFYHLTNVYMFEQDIKSAKKLVAVNLKEDPYNVNVLIQYVWCLVAEDKMDDAKSIYRRLVAEKQIQPQGFTDVAMAYVLKGDFQNARKIINTALSLYPENYIPEDTYYEISEIERSFKEHKLEIFFKNLDKIHFMTMIYTAALRILVEQMTLMGYFRHEVEKAADVIIFLNDKNYKIDNPALLAGAVQFIIVRCFGDDKDTKNIILNKYRITHKALLKTVEEIDRLAVSNDYFICDDVLSGLRLFGDDSELSEEDLNDDD